MKQNKNEEVDDIQSFNDWWQEQEKKGENPEMKYLARGAWNQALSLASNYFGEKEGTDYDVYSLFHA